MNTFDKIEQQILADDGDWETFFIHKALHVLFGALAALITIVITHSGVAGLIAAFMLGVGRESAKETPMLLHVLTAGITASGWVLALFVLYVMGV